MFSTDAVFRPWTVKSPEVHFNLRYPVVVGERTQGQVGRVVFHRLVDFKRQVKAIVYERSTNLEYELNIKNNIAM